jgi:acetoin:2,6-dichlorophenolindophenol oxidoreductase subunit beta
MAKLSYREAIRRALREELRCDPSVVLMGIDIVKAGGVFKVTQGLVALSSVRREFAIRPSQRQLL